ncbi:hypothetical protein Metig_0962 [Methanotorris igneus Kol 5]|uniref:Uncharacterized protein n=1 Tax=Methanotorris igneus (strain DSM 5666 / JCM 11834 / Kol 5) TaxID=880724 RepID=F6BDE4_METIK|nr:hypothetical protein Metig_0962 [Methanotorris igneus Kol 5]
MDVVGICATALKITKDIELLIKYNGNFKFLGVGTSFGEIIIKNIDNYILVMIIDSKI